VSAAGTVRQPVVVEHRTNALLPLATLIDKRVTQAHLRAQIKQVIECSLSSASEPYRV
jgi:hypothetical protein